MLPSGALGSDLGRSGRGRPRWPGGLPGGGRTKRGAGLGRSQFCPWTVRPWALPVSGETVRRRRDRRVSWIYEPDERPKRKHHWDQPRAGVVQVHGIPVSKCPSTLTVEDAEAMLNAGVEWRPRRGWSHDHPQRIYAVADGVLYRATPTNPGRSYHGFPELPGQVPPDPALRGAIMELARADGSEREVERWLRR